MNGLIPAWLDGRLQPVEKMRVHREGLRHKAVSVFVMRGEEVLLQRRALGKYHTPGLWANTCCTHPAWGEAPADCATRRLREELGIIGLTPVPRATVEYRADVGGGLVEHEVVEVFVATANAALTVDPNPAEVMEVRWARLHALRDAIGRDSDHYVPWLRIYLQRHGDAIFRTVSAAPAPALP